MCLELGAETNVHIFYYFTMSKADFMLGFYLALP